MTSMFHIFTFFKDNLQSIERGEKHLQASHVQSFLFDSDFVKGTVQASMRDRVYSVQVFLKDGAIVSAECTCPAGKHKCSHMATILMYAVKNVGPTDQACAWNNPKPAKEHKHLEEYFAPKQYVCLDRKPDEADKEWLLDSLKNHSHTGVHFLLSPEPVSNNVCDVLAFNDLLALVPDGSVAERVEFVLEKLKLSDTDIRSVYAQTVGQKKNYLWGVYRKGRLTSSNFSLALRAIRKGSVPPSTLKTLKGEYKIHNEKTVQWGVVHEDTALQLYEEILNVKVDRVGLLLHPSGKLGCSPDGVVGDIVIEIKCPETKIDKDILREIATGKWYVKFSTTHLYPELFTDGDTSVYVFPNDDICLNVKHPQGQAYYHQVQGVMHLSGKKRCDFIVWTPKTTVIFPVFWDESWKENIDKLIAFYDSIFIYSLIN